MQEALVKQKKKTIYNDVETRLEAVLDDLRHGRVKRWPQDSLK